MWRIEYENVLTKDMAVEYIDGLTREGVEDHAISHCSPTELVYGSYTIEEINSEYLQAFKNKDFLKKLRTRLDRYLEWTQQRLIDVYTVSSVAFGLVCGAALACPDLEEEIYHIWYSEYRSKFY